MLRQNGTRPESLFRWFKRSTRQALVMDSKRYFGQLASLRIPAHVRNAALPSAIHDLGILLMMLMTVTE